MFGGPLYNPLLLTFWVVLGIASSGYASTSQLVSAWEFRRLPAPPQRDLSRTEQASWVLSPNGAVVAIRYQGDPGAPAKLVLQSCVSGEQRVLASAVPSPSAMAFSPESDRIFLCAPDGRLLSWPLTIENGGSESLAAPDSFKVSGQSDVREILISDSSRLVIALGRSGVTITDLVQKATKPLEGCDAGQVGTLAINSISGSIATGGPDGVTIWSAETGKRLYRAATSDMHQLRFGRNGQYLAVMRDHQVLVWDTRAQSQRLVLQDKQSAANDEFRQIAISPDGSALLAYESSGHLVAWKMDGGIPLGRFGPALPVRASDTAQMSFADGGHDVVISLGPYALVSVGPKRAKRLCALLIVDTLAPDISEGVATSGKKLKKVLGEIFAERSQIRASLDLRSLQADDVSPAMIMSTIRGFQLSNEDALLIYYAGHGEMQGARHVLKTSGGRMDRSQLMDFVAQQRGLGKLRLGVLFTDCCSTFANLVPQARSKPAKWAGLACLFLEHEGVVDITAAAPGEAAWYSNVTGGLFSTVLTNLLCQAVPTGKDGFLRWDEFADALKRRTEEYFNRSKVGAVAGELIKGARSQTPMIVTIDVVPH